MNKRKIKSIAGPLMAAILFGLAVRLLIRESQNITWADFQMGLTGVPLTYLLIGFVLVALNYGLLSAYDILALRYVCRSLPLRRVALVSFLGFSLGNNLGSLLAATPIRFRFYSRWGLTSRQIVVLVAMLGLTFWSGLWVLGGVVLVAVPIDLPAEVPLPVGTRTLGAILLGLALTYLLVCFLWRKPWPIGGMRLVAPEPGLMATQASVSALDLLISATTLYLVMPADAMVPFSLVLASFLMAIAVSIITQVPGGLGVLEVILLTLLRDTAGDSVLASVLIFRLLYFVTPLLFGMFLLVLHEIYGGAIEAKHARDQED